MLVLRGTVVFLVAVAVAILPAFGVSAATITNGGFETGNFSGWTVSNQPGGSGDWYVDSGPTSPNGFSVPSPPEGTWAAITDTTGPGSHILYRDIVLEPGATHSLTMAVYYRNQAGSFATPNTLDYTTFPNQQYRIDIVKPTASVTSVSPSDVLVPAFRTDPAEPNSMDPTTLTIDLTPYAGTTVRLRFAQVDNQGVLNAAVDDVRIATTADCLGKAVTMFGTNANDVLVGTPGNDVILAADGADIVKAGAGKDLVCAGGGNDSVSGSGGKDKVDGGSGNDDLKGKAGNDRLIGKAGNDRLNGGAGVDTCKGGPGRDRITKCEKGSA
jgi:Ca2+-binding RTX toxin-like protein